MDHEVVTALDLPKGLSMAFKGRYKRSFISGLLVLTLVICHASRAFAASNSCEMIFSSEESSQIEKLVRSLAELRINLDIAKAKGTKALEFTALNSEYKKKEKEFATYLESRQLMTRAEMREKIKQEISLLQERDRSQKKENDENKEQQDRRRKEQSQKIADSIIDGTRAIFHRVEPGSFKMGDDFRRVDVTLTKAFEMMATKTTQSIWRKVAELANEKLSEDFHLDVDPSFNKGSSHPVESINFVETQKWIGALNKLSEQGDPELTLLIPGHKKGSVYRLPTEAEWEYVARGQGTLKDNFPEGNDPAHILEYGWLAENSESTQPVALKRAIRIDGKDFYDLYGNVHEFVQDGFLNQPPGGVDPWVPSSREIVARGTSFRHFPQYANVGVRFSIPKKQIWAGIGGFRLVREIRD